MKSDFKIGSWNDIKDKHIEVLIPNLDRAVELMKKMGIEINKRDGLYWLVFNKDKELEE